MDAELDPGGCIDLTANDTIDGDIIDLTDSAGMRGASVIDQSPVVVISPADVDNADSFSRQIARRRLHEGDSPERDYDTGDDIIDLEREATPDGVSARAARSNSTIDVDNLSDDDSDLPPAPFSLADASLLSSPEGSKVTCPVCMDSDSHIRRTGRQLYSTTCGHIFCDNCIKQALASQHRCPSCRKRLTGKQIHPLYL